MKPRRLAVGFLVFLATGALSLRLANIETSLVPWKQWSVHVNKTGFAGCGPYGAYISPERLSLGLGPLHLWFPPTKAAQEAADRNNTETAARAAAAKARKHYKVGQRTPDGKLIIYVFKETCADIPEILKTDFGIMLDHSDSPRQLIYTLAEQRTGRIQYFLKLADAQKAIRALPRGASFAHYDKCTTPMAYGFTDNTEQLLTIARRHRLKVLPDHVRVCTCEGMEGCK